MSPHLTRLHTLCLLAVPFAATVLASAQQPTLALAEFPDAPSIVQANQQTMGTLSGTVKDVNGGLVQGATITAASASSQGEFTATSDVSGHFSLTSLPPGPYKVTVRANGLKTLLVPEVDIVAGQQQSLPDLALAAGATSADVSVIATPDQIAIAQVHAEEKQRALGFVPNFYSSYIWNAAPMPTGQKFSLASHSVFDPVGLVSITGIAGAEQWQGTYAGYGDDAAAFGKRYAAAFGDEMIGRYFGSAIYPTLFHQDPRYFYKGAGSIKTRAIYAITRTVITRGDNGRDQPNYSLVLGRFTAGAIANAYHPHADRGIGLTVTNAMLNIGGHAFDNLIREFILRRITPNIPAYADGQNSPNP